MQGYMIIHQRLGDGLRVITIPALHGRKIWGRDKLRKPKPCYLCGTPIEKDSITGARAWKPMVKGQAIRICHDCLD